MNTKKLVSMILIISFLAGCGGFFKKVSPFKQRESTLEAQKGNQFSDEQKNEEIFVCAGDIDTTYKILGLASLGEFGFSGHDILAAKIREKARTVGAQAVINVQYDTGNSKTWEGYGELGGTDYGVKYTSWCKGTAIMFLEAPDPLGLLLCNLTKENREWFGLKRLQNGILVVNVTPGSIAAKAGIKAEDLITEWDREKIENKIYFRHMIEKSDGKETKLSILHAGEIRMVTLAIPVSERSQAISSTSKSDVKDKNPTIEKKETSSIKPSSNASDVHNEVGNLYLRKGMYDEAMEEYRNAIEADPTCAITHFNLSIVYDKKGMKEEADEEYTTYKRLKSQRK